MIINATGMKEYSFQTSTDFNVWKEAIEEESYTYYTKEKEYKPSEGINSCWYNIVEWCTVHYCTIMCFLYMCRRSDQASILCMLSGWKLPSVHKTKANRKATSTSKGY